MNLQVSYFCPEVQNPVTKRLLSFYNDEDSNSFVFSPDDDLHKEFLIHRPIIDIHYLNGKFRLNVNGFWYIKNGYFISNVLIEEVENL